MKKINDQLEIVNGKMARNRIVMPPMDTLFSENGIANEFHIQHYGSRAYGGVGTIIVESTAVLQNGKIRDKDLGLWKDEHIEPMSKIVKISKTAGSIIGVQLNHAGAKSELLNIDKYGTTKKYFDYLDQSKLIIADEKILFEIENAFVESARRAKDAGFDFVELHAAHGYFLSSMISRHLNEVTPNDNIVKRASIVITIAKRIFEEVGIRIGIRISFTDHTDNGMKLDEYKDLIKALESYVDYFHVSSGETIARVRMADVIGKGDKLFRLPLAKEVKTWTNKNVIVVGNFDSRKDVNKALENDIDAVAIGRELLWNPNLVFNKLLETNEIDEEKYHWNNNIWYSPRRHKELKDNLK